jgi:hypothetical protein
MGFLELISIVRKLVLIFFLLGYSNLYFAAKLSLEGVYQGKNVFIQNPSDASGFGFCVSKIYVNGDLMPISLNSSTVIINLKSLKMSIGEPVFLVIHHNDDCTPKIVNPEVLLPKSTFQLNSISVVNSTDLSWSTTGESGKLNFLIEQYKWDKWVVVGEVMGQGTATLNTYSFKLFPHSGKNEVRVSQIDNTLLKRSSKSTLFTSSVPFVSKTPTKVKDFITFKANNSEVETYFEVFDAYGNILKSGKASKVDCRKLLNGLYYLNFDNKTEKIIKN